ncbi:hypothetical protein V8E54_015177 [Elaphomyces granulatus]
MSKGNAQLQNTLSETGAVSLTFREFQTSIIKALNQRCLNYTHASSISFRWESDNTNALADARAFQNIMRLLGFPPAEEYVIPKKSPCPAWDVSDKYSGMISASLNQPGRGIIFVHYAGHGEEHNGTLMLSSGTKKISAERVFFHNVIDGVVVATDNPIDLVFIFDCCYGHTATRTVPSLSRVVEVLAASSFDTPTANTANQRASLTGELANEIAFRKGRGEQSIELAEIVESLRTRMSRIKPTHGIRLGDNSLRFRFPSMPPSLSAVFSVHLSPSLGQAGLKEMIQWIHNLNSDIELSLETAYETDSTLIIFRGRYSLYSKLTGLPGIKLICDTKYPTLSSNQIISIDN